MYDTKTWVLVAEASRARLYACEGGRRPLTEVQDFIHSEGRIPARELESDRSGKARDAAHGMHAMEPRTNAHRKAEQAFARELGQVLTEGLREQRCAHIGLVAPPGFLGLLREELSDEARRHVDFELGKNLTRHSAAEVRGQLPEYL